MNQQTDTITVQVGRWQRVYRAVCTSAPPAYDGMGTLHIETVDDRPKSVERLVLVEVDHLTWQTERYRSGMYFAAVEEDPFVLQAIQDRLWQRLREKE